MNNNIKVTVGGPINADYPKVYKTKFLKPGIPFSLQVTEPDTKYVIKHNFELDSDVTIPENCILEFDGGSLSNGSLVYNDTFIEGNYKLSCSCSGTLNNTIVTPEMYGAKGDGETDDSLAIQAAINGGNHHIVFNAAKYKVDVRNIGTDPFVAAAIVIQSKSDILLEFVNSALELKRNNWTEYRLIDILNSSNIKIVGGEFIGDKDIHDYGTVLDIENKEWDGTAIVASTSNCITTPVPVSILSNFDGTIKKPYAFMVDNGYLDVNNYDDISRLTMSYVLFNNDVFVAVVNSISSISQYPSATHYRIQIDGTQVVDNTKKAYICNSYIDHNNYRKTHENGNGILITNSADIVVEDIVCHKFTGDGVIVAGSLVAATNITIKNSESYDNRRQGITIGGGHNIKIENVYIHDICGNNPSSGIDIELEYSSYEIGTVDIVNCRFENTWSYNIAIGGRTAKSQSRYITIKNCVFDNSVASFNKITNCRFDTKNNKYLASPYKRGNIIFLPENLENSVVKSDKLFQCKGAVNTSFMHNTKGDALNRDIFYGSFDGCYFHKLFVGTSTSGTPDVSNCKIEESTVTSQGGSNNIFIASIHSPKNSSGIVHHNIYLNSKISFNGVYEELFTVTDCEFIETDTYERFENIDCFIAPSLNKISISNNVFLTYTIPCVAGYIPSGRSVIVSNNIIYLKGSSWLSDSNTLANYSMRLKFTKNTINVAPSATVLNSNLTIYNDFDSTSFIIAKMTEAIKTQMEKLILNNEGISVFSHVPNITFNTDILNSTKDDAIKGQLALDSGTIKKCTASSTYDESGARQTVAVWA